MKTKELDFTFPVLKNEEKTRINHMGKCEKTKGVEIFLPSTDELVRDVFEANDFEFQRVSLTEQKGVRAVKTRVNAMMYNWLKFEIKRQGFSEGYTTALYLNNFDEVNKIMEEASKEIYETLRDEEEQVRGEEEVLRV